MTKVPRLTALLDEFEGELVEYEARVAASDLPHPPLSVVKPIIIELRAAAARLVRMAERFEVLSLTEDAAGRDVRRMTDAALGRGEETT